MHISATMSDTAIDSETDVEFFSGAVHVVESTQPPANTAIHST